MDYVYFLDVLDMVEEMEAVEEALPLERVIRDRTNPFDRFDDEDFITRFRLSKGGAHYFFSIVDEDLLHSRVYRGHRLSKEDQLAILLLFMGNDAYQRDCADIYYVDQATISRVVKRASLAVTELRHEWITFPRDLRPVQQQFYDVANIPGK
jgi:hypothetical protein